MNKKGITTLLGTLLYGAFIVGITVLFYSNFSLYTEYLFKSDIYLIENNYIYNISSQTSNDLYKKYFDIKNYKLKLENSAKYITNGSKLLVIDKRDRLISTLINIVKGDIISDGIVDEKDLIRFEDIVENNYQLTQVEQLCLDINNDTKVSKEDLKLLKKALTDGISSMGVREKNINILTNENYRLIIDIYPNYGINTNLKWTSNNPSIASVNEGGLVTGHNNGEAIITVEDLNGTIQKEINIKVDDAIKLSSNQGNAFVTDPELAINIRAINYKNLECQSSNPTISTCRIDKNILYIKSLTKGESTITVTSPKHGSTTYNLTSYESYLDFIPEYYCMSINRSDITNLRYIYNDLNISNNNFTTNTYFKNNQFYIRSKSIPGRDELNISDNIGNNKKLIVDVYNLNIPSIGAFIKKGTEKSAIIVNENTTNLTCKSPNESIATCYIKDNKLYVTGINKGEVLLEITNTSIFNNKEYQCGDTTFLAVISD